MLPFPIFSAALLPFPITLVCTYQDSLLLFPIFSIAFLPFPITPIRTSVRPPPSPLLRFVINWLDHHFNHCCFLMLRRLCIYHRTSSPSCALERDKSLWVRVKAKASKPDMIMGVCYRPAKRDEEVDKTLPRQLGEVSRSLPLVGTCGGLLPPRHLLDL